MAFGVRRTGFKALTSWRRPGSPARIAVAGLASGVMAAQFIAGAAPVAAAVRHNTAPSVAHDKSVPVSPVVSHYTRPGPAPSWHPAESQWPSGAAVARVPAAGRAQAGKLPVWIGSASAQSVGVTVVPRATAASAGVHGVMLTLAGGAASGSAAAGARATAGATVHVTLSYAQFQDAFGGGWNSRLALVQLPACAATSPNVASCRTATPVKFTNDVAKQTLDADVTLPGVPAAATSSAPAVSTRSAPAAAPALVLAADSTTSSDAGSGGGDFTATSLKPSGAWQAGGSSDAFTWSYPLTAPAVPGALVPQLSLSYNSQSVDGLTSSTNNQASWVGDGWGLSESFIERSYPSCHQNPTGTTQTWDNCWSGNDTLTLDLNGSTTTLVKDDTSGGYRAQNDSNERVEYKTGAVNGARNGEYWVVTTSNGTQYWFGYNELPGYASGDATTNSVWTEPVYATASGQPCYNATFSLSWCQQAYRWNLDYVVDTHSDVASYWYQTETNYYAMNKGSTAPAASKYTRGGYLSKIQYGQRAGTVYSSTPAGEISFTVNGRCDSSASGCATSTLSTSTASHWPDTPYDMNCASGATCSTQAPSFWSEYELTGIQTQALVGSTLTNVDSWALAYSFPPIANTTDTTKPSLWLDSITHTGQDTAAGGSASPITLPAVTFTGQAMQNRVNLTNGYPWITRQRMNKIVTETGETISVNYSAPACGSSTPSDDAQNTTLCYPVYWYPTGHSTPVKEYFNKFIVNTVTEQDPTGGSANDTIVTTYTPVGSPAWHYNDNPLMPSNQRTWDQFRGYSGMTVSKGTAPDPTTKTTYTYFRGMDGDYLTSSTNRTVSVTDSRNDTAITDSNQFAGATYETQAFNGAALVADTITDPWTSAATATHALTGLPSQQAFLTGVARTRIYTTLAAGGSRETETDYTHDAYGRVTQTNDLGDVTVAAQHECSTTTYADNTGAWILDKADETKTVSVDCSTTPTLPADAVSDTRTFYDGSATFGAAPAVGDATMSQKAASYSGSTPNYVTTQTVTVDQYGRDTANYDALARKTATAYTPATGAEPTSIAVTDPLGQSTTTGYDALRELPITATTPAGLVTTEQYDALGRLTAVYKPGEVAPNPPNLKYTYSVNNSAPSVIDTYTLNDDSTYRVSEVLYDSLLRAREVQTQTVDGGRDITDTIYNTDGWESEFTDPYYNAAAVSTSYVQAQVGDVPSETGYSYDGMGRKTAAIAYALGTQTWQTTYTYGGNFTTTVPPAGATPTTAVTDARGRTTDLIQYHAGVPADYVNDPPSDYSDAKYTFTSDGKQATETDAAGNGWSWTYNLLGYQTDAYDPDSGHSTSVYDNAGQLTSTTDARGKQTSYVYDLDGRKTAAYDTTATQTESSTNEIASWVFDTVKKGLLTSTTSYSNGDTYTNTVLAYNNIGKPSATKVTLTGEGTTLVPSAGYTTSYGYSLSGLLKTQNDPAENGLPSEILSYGYDQFGEPTSLTSSGGASWNYVAAVGYSELGQVVQYTLPTAGGDVWAKLSYDPQTKDLVDIQTTDSTTSGTLDDLSYTYGNGSGAVSKGSGLLTRTVDSQNAGTTVDTQCFTYDYATRLRQAWTATDSCAATPSSGASATVGGADAPYWQSWTYDAAGNRLTQIDHDTTGATANDTTTAYNYPAAGSATDQPNSLTSTTSTGPNASANTASYGYDAAGNTTSITGGVLGNQNLTWNDQGKLQSDATSAGTTSYVYDTSGNQIVRRDPGSTTFYAGDAQLVLNTATGTTSATRYYSLGATTIAERTSTGSVNVLIPDRQGTDQLAVSTAAAQTVSRRQYLPFGQARGAAAAWVGGDRGYIGGDTDPTTGLETLGARVYDSADGRFMSVDQLFEVADPTQTNGYAYAANNPVTGSDPTGKMREPEGGDGPSTPAGIAFSLFESIISQITSVLEDRGWTNPDVAVHGSRASYTNKANSDLDVAVRVPPEQFNALINERFGDPNPDSAKWRTMQTSIRDGRIQRGEMGLSGLGKKLQAQLEADGVDLSAAPPGSGVQISVIEIGGKFDNGPFIRPRGATVATASSAVSDGGKVARFLDAAEPALKWGGRALVVAGVAASIWDVATAPPGQKVHTAIHDSGSLAGGLIGAAEGATIGSAFAPPVGTVVGGVIGGVIGSGVGGMVADGAEKAWNTVSSWF